MARSMRLEGVGAIITNTGEIPRVDYDLVVPIPSPGGEFVDPGRGRIRIANLHPMHAGNLFNTGGTLILRLAHGRDAPIIIETARIGDGIFTVQIAGAIAPANAP